jgi:hypothetical protein
LLPALENSVAQASRLPPRATGIPARDFFVAQASCLHFVLVLVLDARHPARATLGSVHGKFFEP